MDNNKPPTSDYFIDWREPYRVIALARGFKKLLAVTGFEEPGQYGLDSLLSD